MAEPPGLSRWKAVNQSKVDRLATFLSTEPNTTLRATHRTAYVQQLQRYVEAKYHWANALVDHLTTVKDLLEQGTQGMADAPSAAGRTSAASPPSTSRRVSSRKSGGLG